MAGYTGREAGSLGLPAADEVWPVGELNRRVRACLEQQLPLHWVAGEISNLTLAASGHWYFSLKDERAQVRCVMFRHRAMFLDWKPQAGMQVEVRASATLYEPRGEFQLQVDSMRRAGLGALYEAFDRLRRRLLAEGLFDEELKRAVPAMPRQIGVVTSLQAAALRDVLITLRRRMPGIPVVIYPTPVQGVEAPARIVAALQAAATRRECDVLLVCRGGGSIEDLWAFNDEAVVRAIAACPVPVVSGVGHETDVTLVDFVADVRAATPTAAAERVTPDRQAMVLALQHWRQRSQAAMQRALLTRSQRLDLAARRLLSPLERIAQVRVQLSQREQRLQRAMRQYLERQRLLLRQARVLLVGRRADTAPLRRGLQLQADRLQRGWQHQATLHRQRLQAQQRHLEQLNPQRVLERGFVVVEAHQGLLTRADQGHAGEAVRLRFADGRRAAVLGEVGPGAVDA